MDLLAPTSRSARLSSPWPWWWLGRLQVTRLALGLALALGLLLPQRSAAGAAHAPGGPDPVTVAIALNTAWDGGEATAVLAFFAEGAVVRQEVVPVGYLTGAPEGAGPPATIAGVALLEAWVATLVARHYRAEASGYAAAGDRVTWTYRAYLDPYQQIPGVPPVCV